MIYSQYCRIEKRAGGVGCTNVEFIRAAHKSLLSQSRFHHLYRADRHAWLRAGLALLEKSRQQYVQVNRGDYWIVGKVRGVSQ